MKSLLTIGVAIALSNVSFGSGFKCESEDGANVKIFNHVDPETGTRTPAAFVLSTAGEGTLLVRKGWEIRKSNRRNTVQYVVDGGQNTSADTVILQIRFKEGREVLEAGETAQGQLIVIGAEEPGSKSVTALECARYLKNE